MAHTNSFAERVDAAEQKAQRIEDANNTQQRIESVTDSIDDLQRELGTVAQRAEELNFYVGILETVFNGSRSDCYGLSPEIDDARRKANISDEEIIDAAEDQSFAEHRSALREAGDHLDSAIDTVKSHIKTTYVEEYNDELDSARELNAIISGENDQFVTHVKQMQSFLNKDIWRTDKSVTTLASRWDRMRDQWQAHSDKQGWERFQQQHGLSETTVTELQQFTDEDEVKLSDLSIETLKETKRVDELESALEVTVQT
jgi:predicted nuclease with TOPRIM domain